MTIWCSQDLKKRSGRKSCYSNLSGRDGKLAGWEFDSRTGKSYNNQTDRRRDESLKSGIYADMEKEKADREKNKRQWKPALITVAVAAILIMFAATIFAGSGDGKKLGDAALREAGTKGKAEIGAVVTEEVKETAEKIKEEEETREKAEEIGEAGAEAIGKAIEEQVTPDFSENVITSPRDNKKIEILNGNSSDEAITGRDTGKESDPERYEEEHEEGLKKEAEDILSGMTLEEKVYQMFIITPEQLTGVKPATTAGSVTKDSLQKYPVGGLAYFSPNLVNAGQTSEMLENSQGYALEIEGLPLFLCVDEEGGRIARVANNASFGLSKTKAMGKMESAEEAFEAGSAIGRYLSDLGFNVDFAPDADVLTNPENKVIGNRSFGDDPAKVAEYAAAYSDGLHQSGVLSTFKHFPGHGATAGDTHDGFAYIDKTLEELKENELIPFATAQNEDVDLVMVSHISVPAVLGDDTPCTLSRYMVTDLLRGEMEYKGLIITDAMNMGAITKAYDNDQAVIDAVRAGVDLILMPVDFQSASEAVIAAVRSEEIDSASIDESVKRIIVKKLHLMEKMKENR